CTGQKATDSRGGRISRDCRSVAARAAWFVPLADATGRPRLYPNISQDGLRAARNTRRPATAPRVTALMPLRVLLCRVLCYTEYGPKSTPRHVRGRGAVVLHGGCRALRPAEQPGSDVVGDGPQPRVADRLAVDGGHMRHFMAHDEVGGGLVLRLVGHGA